jgi:uncharacterized protein involved in tolerance to divalent cations
MYGGYGGGPTVIDNIATEQECQRISTAIKKQYKYEAPSIICLEVRKVK